MNNYVCERVTCLRHIRCACVVTAASDNINVCSRDIVRHLTGRLGKLAHRRTMTRLACLALLGLLLVQVAPSVESSRSTHQWLTVDIIKNN